MFSISNSYDPIASQLLSVNLNLVILSLPMLHPCQGQEEAWTLQISELDSSCADYITPEFLSKQWNIGLDLVARTLKATTHQL